MESKENSQFHDYNQKDIFWNDIESAGIEEYDEAFLASVRSELKILEEAGVQFLIVPKRFSGIASFWGCSEGEIMSEEKEQEFFEIFTATMVHLARRIKDCKNIAGFIYPDFQNDWPVLQHYENEYKENFKAAFQKKHSHYIFVERD